MVVMMMLMRMMTMAITFELQVWAKKDLRGLSKADARAQIDEVGGDDG